MTDPAARTVLETATMIVSAYVSNHAVNVAELPLLIAQTHAAVLALQAPASEPVPEALTPAVAIKKSVTPDHLISLEDGRKFKSLKRHLSGLGMTPDQYRLKWQLPHDYPMVAANYAASRSALAKSLGLGRKPKVPVEEEAVQVPASAPKKKRTAPAA